MRDLMDLTVAEVEAIETMAETSIERWNSPKGSKARLFKAILCTLDGADPDAVQAMTMRELARRVSEVLRIE